MNDGFISVGGRQVPYQSKMVHISKIKLDLDNPRLHAAFDFSRVDKTQDSVEQLLMGYPGVRELLLSIKEHGGLLEPITVLRKEKNLIVQEGNCRLVCLKRLVKETGNEKFSVIPVNIVEEKNFSEDSKDSYLGTIHVGKKNDWSTFDQAAHIYRQLTVHGRNVKSIEKELKMSPQELSKRVACYKHTQAYIKKYPSDKRGTFIFSFFIELLSNNQLKNRVANDPGFVDVFMRWVFEKKIISANEVRQLPQVLDIASAYSTLSERGLREAVLELKTKKPEIEASFYRSMYKFRRMAHNLSSKAFTELKDNKIAALKEIELVMKELGDLKRRLAKD